MKFLGVSGVFDYAGLEQELALALLPMLPSAHVKGVGVRIYSFRSWIPTPPIPCLGFAEHLAMPGAKLGAEWFAAPFS
jgi:hypothetical protein